MQSSLPRTLSSSTSPTARALRTRSPITSWSRAFSENREESNTEPVETTPSEQVRTPTSARSKAGFAAWKEGEGDRFRRPIKGRTNWIGDTPFPLNPTFRPFPPLSDTIKEKIYNAYTSNILSGPEAKDSIVVRAVSMKFGVAADRVRAVVRLKELEKRWRDEGRTLQTELRDNMESYLGVQQPDVHWRGKELPASGVDSEKERAKVSARTVFEMVDVEGNDQPVLLPLLKHLRQRSAPPHPASEASSKPTTPAATTPAERKYPASRPGRAGLLVRDLEGTEEGRKLEASREVKRR